MKITVYTITDCAFCKAEKDYLTAHNLPFEEKNVEENREFLSEMLELSDKFAGVPFTYVMKDDGSHVGLKGFTEEEFNTALNVQAAVQPQVAPAMPAPTPVVEPPVAQPTTEIPSVSTPPASTAGAVGEGGSSPAEAASGGVPTEIPESLQNMLNNEPIVDPAPEPQSPMPPMPDPMPAPQPIEEPTMPQTSDELNSVLNNLTAMSAAAPSEEMPKIPDLKT